MARKAKTKPYHHGDLREALIAAGTDIIESDGLAAFTLRECARRAGVSHAAPRNHFESIDDLIGEIAARGFESFHAELEAAAAKVGPSPDDRLRAMGVAYVKFAMGRPGVYGLMFRMGKPLKSSPHLTAASQAAWMQLVNEVQRVIGPDRKDAPLRAAHVWSLVHGLASLAIDKRLHPSVTVEDVARSAAANLPQYLRMSDGESVLEAGAKEGAK